MPPSRSMALVGILTGGLVYAAGGCGGGTNGAGMGGHGGGVSVSPLVVSTTTRTPRTTTWSVNYWTWSPSYVDALPGTETLVKALAPALMRVGGYNNDANRPDPFDDAQLDAAVTYARAIGAEPIIQVPLLADTSGQPPTAQEAAAMVTYANTTMGYGIKYFSIGNEPDLYDTQGSLTNSTQPAIPGYTPSQFCASAQAYVAAMKGADPTIQIVGPELSYKYQAGNGSYDWLTPILQQCGQLFDIVSIHRYPFEAAQASLAAAEADPAAFRRVMTSVRGILTATGNGAKPLALTEMNVAYDATTCVLDASPGTIGSALWLADSVGTAMELGLWTTAVWDISDPDNVAFGLIGLPPAHTPRPEYYAYQLYADHVGPTLLAVPSVPAGVSAHASRNQADDATEVIVANWNASPVGINFQVTGLAKAPAATTYILPAVSLAAVELPDTGPASAWSYGEAQRQSALGPQPLAADVGLGPSGAGGRGGGAGGTDGGTGGGPGAGVVVGTGCGDAAVVCPQIVLPGPVITTAGTGSGTTMSFGAGSTKWGSYLYAASGQTAPSVAATADGNGIQISGGFAPPILAGSNYIGVGLYYSSASCIDASAYKGVKFDFAGDLGGCSLSFGASFSGDESHGDDPRGGCFGTDSTCYGPAFTVTPTASPTTLMVPFSSLGGGRPFATIDPTTLLTVQWQLGGQPNVTDGGACSASFTVSNVAFY